MGLLGKAHHLSEHPTCIESVHSTYEQFCGGNSISTHLEGLLGGKKSSPRFTLKLPYPKNRIQIHIELVCIYVGM